jgi:site-specific recombinase XerD
MLHHKIGIEVVQIAVGHNDIRMTQGYNHPTKEQLYSAIKQRIN